MLRTRSSNPIDHPRSPASVVPSGYVMIHDSRFQAKRNFRVVPARQLPLYRKLISLGRDRAGGRTNSGVGLLNRQLGWCYLGCTLFSGWPVWLPGFLGKAVRARSSGVLSLL